MYITPEELIKNIETALEKTAEELKPTMQQAALDAKALLALRVQNKGIGRKYTSRSYAALRVKKGLQIQFVNLTFSGKMFQNWRTPGSFREGLKVTGYMGGTDEETKKKLRWNKNRFPDFDHLTKEEGDIITENLVTPKVIEILTKNIFS